MDLRKATWTSGADYGVEDEEEHRSSYLLMLNNITNDLDLLLSDFCQLSYPDTEEPAPLANKPMRTFGKKPMQFENCSAFGGSSTSGTLTSTDSNHSNKDARSGTLTSTDSNNSCRKPRSISCQSGHLDVFGLACRGLEIPSYPDRHSGSLSPASSDSRQITCQERITKTHPVWFLPQCGRTGAVHLLKNRDVGIFLVRKSSRDDVMALSVQFPTEAGVPNVDHYLIEPTESGLHLQGSNNLFRAIPNLIAYYCEHKEDLPHHLVLPPAIRQAKTSQELTALAMLGQDFWTSSKFDGGSRGTSRASSKSNLSDHSSLFNKSTSEPISIANKSPVPVHSKSESVLQNSPPKHSVIDFSSYLIQKRTEKIEISPVRTTASVSSASESVQSKCSVSEIKPSNHTTGSVFCFGDGDPVCHSESVGHTGDVEAGVQLPAAECSQTKVSVKPKSNLYFTTSLDLLHLPEDLYFTSNLSDKLSDYEDIWKTSGPPSVHTDIAARLQPNHSAKYAVTDHRRVQEQMVAHDSHVTQMVAHDNHVRQMVTHDNHVTQMVAHDNQVAQMVALDNGATKERVDTVDNSNHVESFSASQVAVKETAVMLVTESCVAKETVVVEDDSSGSVVKNNNCVLAVEASLHNNFNCEMCEDKVLQKDDSQKMSGFEPIPEMESDIDSDSCHSDSCHSADDADTEEGDVRSASVHTQTSPVAKFKPPPLPPTICRKSASTSSLSTMKSPVYAEPFDAINPISKDIDDTPKLPLKMRRRSAPAVGLSRRKYGTAVNPKLPPILSPRLQNRQCSSQDQESPASPVTDSVSPNLDKTPPRQTLHCEAGSPNEVPNCKGVHEVANRQEKEKEKQDKQYDSACQHRLSSRGVVYGDRHVIDPFHFMEDFEKSRHMPSSPTLNKFPVYNKQVSTETKCSSCTENSTVEDIITCWNPELTVKPLQLSGIPFPFSDRLGPVSEYDNLNAAGYIAPSGQSIHSVGTIFCKPWDSSVWGKIIGGPNHHVPPPLPPPMDPRERIKAWQESSQNYHSVPTDTEEERRRSVISDACSVETKTFGGDHCSVTGLHVSSNGLGGHSDKTLVNEKPPLPQPKNKEEERGPTTDQVPLFGADFREKVAPILANPRLLHQTSRGRNPDSKIRDYVIRLSKDDKTTFGSTISNFIQCTLESQDTNPFHVTRNVRQFMNGIKNYLVKHGEGELEDLIERERSMLGADEILNIDAILESALHVCVLRPLKQDLYRLFVNEYTSNGNLKLLSSNIKYARTKTPQEIGIRRGLSPPDAPTLQVIKQFLTRMQKSYSPLKKLENLLGATSSIYKCVSAKSAENGVPTFGADDFLPMLIYVLIQCGMVSVEIEADYMWGLLHPSLLTGEGGYYLTSLSSAVLVLKNFREMQETKTTKVEGKLPSISDMQGFLKLAIPDELRDTIVWKTLPIRPNMTTKDICTMIAHKFKITNPQDYGLYTLDNGEECKLADSECPQVLKADRLATGKDCVFAYKRNAANIAWPKSVKGI